MLKSQVGSTMAYFALAQLDTSDHANNRLWATSVAVQRAIQEPGDLASPDGVGAQQAMLRPNICNGIDEDSVLPWVPDMVGRQWRDLDALLVVGTAYAGFISEFAGRHQGNTMPLERYRDLVPQPVANFHTEFLNTVVKNDSAFYDPVSDLLNNLVKPAKIALFDLCRASFVRRGQGDGRRIDSSKEGRTVCAKPEIYSEYVEWIADPDGEELGPRAWTWARIRDSKAKCIVALGRVSEHGILRALKWNLTNFTVRLKSNPAASADLLLSDKRWAGKYANDLVKMGHWYPLLANQKFDHPDQADWWCADGSAGREDRRWRVVTVHHPSSHGFRARIEQSRKRIELAQLP